MRSGSSPRTREGTAIDLPGAVDPAAVVAAVRDESTESGGPEARDPPPTVRVVATAGAVAVASPPPGPAHEHVGLVDGDDHLPLRAALAAAARSRGGTAPQDDAIAACRRELADLDPPTVERTAARRRVAEVGVEEERLHERVARLRGRVRALRDRGLDASEAERDLADAVARLSEARTERIAAEQALERTTDRARAARDVRERRLRLEDRIGNLRRRAREHLAAGLYADFRDALAAVPGEGAAGERPGEYAGDDTTAALAVARVADVRAPVVVACGRFSDAGEAARVLDGPVIRIAGGE